MFRRLAICAAALTFIPTMADMIRPPISSTVYRQTQTAMLTRNLVASRFALRGLYVDFLGDKRAGLVQEFPLYNYAAGGLSRLGVPLEQAGKALSLAAFLVSVLLVYRIAGDRYSGTVGFATAVLFIVSPLSMLMRSSFQPDVLSMMFVLLAIRGILLWREKPTVGLLVVGACCLSLAALTKIVVVIPYSIVLALCLFTKGHSVRLPSLAETGIMIVVVVLPVALWYGYAVPHYTEPRFLVRAESMFLIGDLHRFLVPSLYLKLLFLYGAYLFCAGGVLFAVVGLWRADLQTLGLALGIPFYLVVVPTAAEQHYYSYAILPIACLLMGRGMVFVGASERRLVRVGFAVTLMSFVVFSVVAAQYLLRPDAVFYEAGQRVRHISQRHDLVLSLALHDRVYVGQSWYPEMMYFAERNGWDLPLRSLNEPLLSDVDQYRSKGARWLVLTRYTPTLEPWFVRYIPSQFARRPSVDGDAVEEMLAQRFAEVVHTANISIYDLRAPRA